MYETKAGHLIRLLGRDTDVNRLRLEDIVDYVQARRAETAHQHTIHKELLALYGALRLAKKQKRFRFEVDDLKIDGWESGYVPGDRFLSEAEYVKLEQSLAPKRRLRLRFHVLTGANLGESEKVSREHVDFERRVLTLPGTKTKYRHREIPFSALPELERLLHELVDSLPEEQEQLFEPWGNMRRDLTLACERIGIASVNTNDLRRTFCSWLAQRGVPVIVAAHLMGHGSTKMVETVYARIDHTTKNNAMALLGDISFGELGAPQLPQNFHKTLPTQDAQDASDRSRMDEEVEQALRSDAAKRRNALRKAKAPTPSDVGASVPRDRIELPTRGFSVRTEGRSEPNNVVQLVPPATPSAAKIAAVRRQIVANRTAAIDQLMLTLSVMREAESEEALASEAMVVGLAELVRNAALSQFDSPSEMVERLLTAIRAALA
jgi:integrase